MVKLRAKIASSVSNIERPEDFQWAKWLRPPKIETESFSFAKPKLNDKATYTKQIEAPTNDVIFFDIPEIHVLELRQINRFLNVRPTKSIKFEIPINKTGRVFFAINSGKVTENKFVNKLIQISESIKLVARKIELPIVRNISFTSAKTINFALNEYLLRSQSKILIPSELNNKFDFSFELSQSDNFIEDFTDIYLIQQSLYFGNITQNLISYENLTKLKSKEQLDKFFLFKGNVSQNLLDSSEGIKISTNLLEFIPETVDLALLNIKDFSVEVKFISELNIKNDEHGFTTKSISLLELKDDSTEIFSRAPNEFEFKNKIVNDLKIKSFGIPDISKNLNFENQLHEKPLSLNVNSINISLPNTHSSDIDELTIPECYEFSIAENPVLLPGFDDNFEKLLPAFNNLYEFQKTGTEFLVRNQFAILADEKGLGKKLQSISALRILMKRGAVKNVLILTNNFEFGRKDLSELRKKPIGWEGYFNFWAPELSVRSIKGSNKGRKLLWKIPSQVSIAALDDFLEDMNSSSIHKSHYSKFNLILIDNNKAETINNLYKAVSKISISYLWYLHDNFIDDELSKAMIRLKSIVKEYIKSKPEDNTADSFNDGFILRRTRSEIAAALPKRIYFEKWIDLDEEQDAEYKITMQAGKNKIATAVEVGNIFMIQPQIFGVVHQLMQTFNYSGTEFSSPKEKLLLSQIENFKASKEKAVIFTQYEKNGINLIENLFNKNEIGFRTYKSGTSESALVNNLKDFVSNDEICALIIDSKALRNVLNLGKSVHHIIHFDHWWNPVSTWQLEDKILTYGETLNVYTYLTSNSIEENIYKILAEKNLLNKNLMDTLSASNISDMVTTEDWLEVLEIESNDKKDNEEVNPVSEHINKVHEKLNSLTSEEFEELGKGLFSKLGYGTNAFINNAGDQDKGIFITSKKVNNKEETIVVKFVHEQNLEPTYINNFRTTLGNYKNISKTFLVTSGILSKDSYQFPEIENNSINIIDGLELSSYLVQFNIM